MTSTLRCCICLNLTHRACGKTGFPVLISESSETLRLGYSHCEEQRTKTAASGLAAHICGHDGIGRHARFRFSCFPALGFESPCPHQTKIIRTRSSLWETGSDYLGSMSIVGVEANKFGLLYLLIRFLPLLSPRHHYTSIILQFQVIRKDFLPSFLVSREREKHPFAVFLHLFWV